MNIKSPSGLTITRAVYHEGKQYVFPTLRLAPGDEPDSIAKRQADDIQWAVSEKLKSPRQPLASIGTVAYDRWIEQISQRIAVEVRQLSQGRRVIDGVVLSVTQVGVHGDVA